MRIVANDAFFALLRAGLWADCSLPLTACRLPENVDWEAVMKLAEEQSVMGLVAVGIERFKLQNSNSSTSEAAKASVKIPRTVALQLIGQTLQLEQRNKEMNEFIAKLLRRMQKEGVYALLVKGQGVAKCYERPLWRVCGDVDLFLDDENYGKAKAFLTPLASLVETEYKSSKHLGMTIGDWVVELHGSLRGGISSRLNKVLDEIQLDTFKGGDVREWDNNGVTVFMLGVTNDVLYIFAHFINHFYKEGLGLRQICDWCRLLWTYRYEIDLKRLERRVKQMGLLSEWRAFGAYAVEYLGMPVEAMPLYSTDKKWVRKARLINKFILGVGNMGHNRDTSYFQKYPFVIRKAVSMGRRIGDLVNHALIFPQNSMRYFPMIIIHGIRAAMRREG